MLQDINEMKKRSVTSDEVTKASKTGVVNYFLQPIDTRSIFALPPSLPQFWSQKRDDFLAATVYHENMWQSAVGVATTKMAALGWNVKGEIGLRARKGHDMLMASEAGAGWVNFISKHMQAFLLTGNGAFVEIVRASRSGGSRVLGLMHLDPHRCVRTGDPHIPVLYRDRLGKIHELRDHQVFMISDMPDHREMYYGVGHCAAEKAYSTIYKLSAIEQFMREKVAGRKPLAIHFLSGVLKSHVDDILQSAQGEASRRGVQSYMGAAIATIAGDQPPQLVTVPLAEIPSGFIPEEERQNAYLIYARALGLDLQDIAPLSSGRGFGTATQSRVLDEKSKGMGATVAWRQAFTHMLNEFVFSEYVNFFFIEKDYRDEQAAIGVSSARASYIATVIQAGIITPQQGLQMLVDTKDLPRDFLPKDSTLTETYSDSERADAPFPYPPQEQPVIGESVTSENPEAAPPQGAPVEEAPAEEVPAEEVPDEEVPAEEAALSEEGKQSSTSSSEVESGVVFDEDGDEEEEIKSYFTKKELSDNPFALVSYKTFAWQKNAGKNPKGGLNAKGRASAKKQGHNLQPPVLSAKTLGEMKRQYSFLSRMSGNPGPERDEKGNPTRLLLSLRVWGASSKTNAKKKAKILKRKIEAIENKTTKEMHAPADLTIIPRDKMDAIIEKAMYFANGRIAFRREDK